MPKKILTFEFGANPDPVTVTLEPGGPLVGDNVTSGAALALSKPTVIILARRIEIANRVTYFCTAISRSSCIIVIYILHCQRASTLLSKLNGNTKNKILNCVYANMKCLQFEHIFNS